MFETLGYTYYYGPDVERDYKNPLFKQDLENLYIINRNLDRNAVDKAIEVIEDFGIASLEDINDKLINEPFICENTTGTAIHHTDKGLVLNLECPMSEDVLKFSETFKIIRSKIILNTNEINELQKLRDTLLPKLMSGEIDVSKINFDLEL